MGIVISPGVSYMVIGVGNRRMLFRRTSPHLGVVLETCARRKNPSSSRETKGYDAIHGFAAARVICKMSRWDCRESRQRAKMCHRQCQIQQFGVKSEKLR
ncbi:hypothetical protein N7450_007428 [Penicillium hetheringtonii]|uniref:Uncharacterized protein n=1 Tax=Penicillium hetheringtonii TaxID=911720 RepID=A0AAD6GPS4_9EURO|nr:hypothetical protein N7450_007428 [Penicillium hetheringtonii]